MGTGKKYLSDHVVNEQVCMMGNCVLRTILASIKSPDLSWFDIIAYETRDVSNKKQLKLTIRWVSEVYTINQDPVGLFSLPNATANTIVAVTKDVLIRCGLPFSLCRGQRYDGASSMQGRRTGVVAQVLSENAAVLPLHCFAHSLNFCLQDAGRQIKLLHYALEIVREMGKLTKFSPKRAHVLSQKLSENEYSTANFKTLCHTRWTARTGAIKAVLKNYAVLMDTMDEINQTIHNEYGMKAGGMSLMKKFDTLFSLKLAYLMFAAAEKVPRTLLGEKNITTRSFVCCQSCERILWMPEERRGTKVHSTMP